MTKGKGARKTATRSETVSVRLEPRLRYLADLAARKQRRTVSSFVECAVEEYLKNVELSPGVSLTAESRSLWAVDEPLRFVKLALAHEDLLTHGEQILWQRIKENSAVWDASRFDWKDEGGTEFDFTLDALMSELLREHWGSFKRVASGEASPDILPKPAKKNPPPGAGRFSEEG